MQTVSSVWKHWQAHFFLIILKHAKLPFKFAKVTLALLYTVSLNRQDWYSQKNNVWIL